MAVPPFPVMKLRWVINALEQHSFDLTYREFTRMSGDKGIEELNDPVFNIINRTSEEFLKDIGMIGGYKYEGTTPFDRLPRHVKIKDIDIKYDEDDDEEKREAKYEKARQKLYEGKKAVCDVPDWYWSKDKTPEDRHKYVREELLKILKTRLKELENRTEYEPKQIEHNFRLIADNVPGFTEEELQLLYFHAMNSLDRLPQGLEYAISQAPSAAYKNKDVYIEKLASVLEIDPKDLKTAQASLERRQFVKSLNRVDLFDRRAFFGSHIQIPEDFQDLLAIRFKTIEAMISYYIGEQPDPPKILIADDYDEGDGARAALNFAESVAQDAKAVGEVSVARSIVGPRGTGKTTALRFIQDHTGIPVFVIDPRKSRQKLPDLDDDDDYYDEIENLVRAFKSSVKDGEDSEANNKRVMANLRFAVNFAEQLGIPMIIALDDAEELYDNDNLKSEINKLKDQSRVPIVEIFNNIESLQPHFMSRLSPPWFLLLSPEDRRTKVFEKWVNDLDLEIKDEDIQRLSREYKALASREIMRCAKVVSLIKQAREEAGEEYTTDDLLRDFEDQLFNTAKAMRGGVDPLPLAPEKYQPPYRPELHGCEDLEEKRKLILAMDKPNPLIAVTGPDNSGRSTFAKKLLNEMGHTRVVTANGESMVNDFEEYIDRIGYNAFEQSRREQRPLIVNNANVLLRTMTDEHEFVRRMKAHQYPIILIGIGVSPLTGLELDHQLHFRGLDEFSRLAAFYNATGLEPDLRVQQMDADLAQMAKVAQKIRADGKQDDPKYAFNVIHAMFGNAFEHMPSEIRNHFDSSRYTSLGDAIEFYPDIFAEAPFRKEALQDLSERKEAAKSKPPGPWSNVPET